MSDSRPKVTQVAEAIWQANQPPGAPEWGDLTFQDQDVVEIIARKCIQAMREPTDEMLEAGPGEPYMDRIVWAKMIDAALEE